jgi:Protein of unknown function (DUF1553)
MELEISFQMLVHVTSCSRLFHPSDEIIHPTISLGCDVLDGQFSSQQFQGAAHGKSLCQQRSVYVPVLRNALPELLEVFDFPDTSRVTGQRNVTTVAPQSLFLMNHPFVIEEARHFAERLLGESGLDDRARVEEAYQLALGRHPAQGELRVALKYLGEPTASRGARLEAWALLCHPIFASADFRYLD